ncbi:hypothetical protein DPMN_166806 [Dreissena polymorpha]|uniref:Uncharacterized protein n=1 Tax=Dreissena polymorpha TaxID=45954 RepID=A0A9D4IXQ6_DREPO|nr:hypothetical protein DPMN_166806 [Dreissena polymorpha]
MGDSESDTDTSKVDSGRTVRAVKDKSRALWINIKDTLTHLYTSIKKSSISASKKQSARGKKIEMFGFMGTIREMNANIN